MAILRVKARWTGFSGAPGYTVLHFNNFSDPIPARAQAAVNATRAFFFGIQSLLPTSVTITVDSAVDVLEEATGQLTDLVSVTPVPTVTGMNTSSFSAPTGALIHWLTGGVRNGRRVRGKSFLVPLTVQIYQTDGTLNAGNMSTISTAAQALIDAENVDLVVYGRPVQGGSPGVAHLVTGQRVPDMAAVLRSRRD